jgi:hypothetical protein
MTLAGDGDKVFEIAEGEGRDWGRAHGALLIGGAF